MSNTPRPRRAARALLELLFPGSCLLCGRALADETSGHPVCAPCLAAIRPICGPRCRVCGMELVSEHGICTRCRQRSYGFESARPIHAYGGAVRELIYLYKFEARRRLAGLFAEWTAAALAASWPGLPLVPVPGRGRLLRRRGWEHVGEIARVLARRHGVEVLARLCRRAAGEQKGLGFAERSTHMKGRIDYRGEELAGDVVLFDDVLTTGATADECARVLREHGASRVFLLTLAID